MSLIHLVWVIFLKKYLFLIFLILISCNVNANELDLSAKSAILYEPVTDRVVYGLNENQSMPMASTTKIATAITVIENSDISDIVTVSKNAAEVEGSSIWLEEGERMTVEDLLYGLMLSSGNDAAVALSEHLTDAGTNFIDLMNNLAQKVGCQNTHFENPNGLDHENHYTTSYDLAKITAYAMNNKYFRDIVSTKKKSISWENHEYNRIIQNHNKLLSWYDGCIGVKTGYTKKDGRCLVSAAERNGITLIAVTLNAPDDWNDHIKLLNYGFDSLKCKTILDKETKFNKLKISNIENCFLSVVYERGLKVPLKEDDTINYKTSLKDVVAPVEKNDVVGYTDLYLGTRLIDRVNIVSKEKIILPEENKMLNFLLKILINILG